jgi:hypothetical protein
VKEKNGTETDTVCKVEVSLYSVFVFFFFCFLRVENCDSQWAPCYKLILRCVCQESWFFSLSCQKICQYRSLLGFANDCLSLWKQHPYATLIIVKYLKKISGNHFALFATKFIICIFYSFVVNLKCKKIDNCRPDLRWYIMVMSVEGPKSSWNLGGRF